MCHRVWFMCVSHSAHKCFGMCGPAELPCINCRWKRVEKHNQITISMDCGPIAIGRYWKSIRKVITEPNKIFLFIGNLFLVFNDVAQLSLDKSAWTYTPMYGHGNRIYMSSERQTHSSCAKTLCDPNVLCLTLIFTFSSLLGRDIWNDL